MRDLLKNGYQAKMRPSGHDISEKFSIDNGAAIPPNLIAIANTESNSHYLRYCKEKGLEPNPARFPAELPEYFIRMLTDPKDLVLDPFAGSCITGEVAERLKRKWICVELIEDYLKGAMARFHNQNKLSPVSSKKKPEPAFYKAFHPAACWHRLEDAQLHLGGGRKRLRVIKSPNVTR